MIPQMVKNGYSKVFATDVTICGSVQAILVPPSHNSIIYSIAPGGPFNDRRDFSERDEQSWIFGYNHWAVATAPGF